MADIKPISAKNLAVESKPLFVPPLKEVAKGKNISKSYLYLYPMFTNIPDYINKSLLLYLPVLQDGLSKNFVNAEVNAVDCPNLSEQPFNLASKGTN